MTVYFVVCVCVCVQGDGGSSRSSSQEIDNDEMTSSQSASTSAIHSGGGGGASSSAAVHESLAPLRRRRASMQDALDFTKINASLYERPVSRSQPIHTARRTFISTVDMSCGVQPGCCPRVLIGFGLSLAYITGTSIYWPKCLSTGIRIRLQGYIINYKCVAKLNV